MRTLLWRLQCVLLPFCVLAALLAKTDANACPAALFINGFTKKVDGPRRGLRLFAKTPAVGPETWHAIPLEVDPVDGEGRLVFFDDDKFLDQGIDPLDLLTFRAEDFGGRFDPRREKLPCNAGLVYELYDEASRRYAYLTNCGKNAAPVAFAQLVNFDKGHHLLQSPTYQYRFNPDNYMQFEGIKFRTQASSWEDIATDSRMLIRADVKNFFTMSFDSRHIESHLEESRLGPMGNLARVSFFLRILLFKIRMSLATDVGFFSDSSHIPMMVNIPVNAFDYLRPGSGILYSWVLSPIARAGARDMHMPDLDPNLVHRGFGALSKLGLSYCNGADCQFRYTVDIRGQRLSMDLGIRRELVERGFFPMFVDNVATLREAMDWDMESPPAEHRSGMYFEVSGLQEGGHPWDFWMRLGSPTERPKACPTSVRWLPLSVVPSPGSG